MNGEVYISDHAVVRWLERHDGLDLAPIRARLRANGQHPTDAAVLVMLKHARQIDADRVRRRMATPALEVAVRCGATAVRVDGVRVVIVDGRVVTVRLAEWDLKHMNQYAGDLAAPEIALRRAELSSRDSLQDAT